MNLVTHVESNKRELVDEKKKIKIEMCISNDAFVLFNILK
jgi:hypothetical protein